MSERAFRRVGFDNSTDKPLLQGPEDSGTIRHDRRLTRSVSNPTLQNSAGTFGDATSKRPSYEAIGDGSAAVGECAMSFAPSEPIVSQRLTHSHSLPGSSAEKLIMRMPSDPGLHVCESSSIQWPLTPQQKRKDVPMLASIDLFKGHREITRKDILGYAPVPTQSESDGEDGHALAPPTIRSWLKAGASATSDFCSPQHCRLKIQAVVNSIAFQAFTLLSILANAIVIGFETDYPDWECWESIENGFLIIFTSELCMRLAMVGPRQFFCGIPSEEETLPASLPAEHGKLQKSVGNRTSDESARRRPPTGQEEVLITLVWNFFDFTIVMIGLCDTLADYCLGSKVLGGDVTLFRAVRLLRILRILRVIRILRFLKQLYLLAYGFMEGTLAVFWVTILASCCIYIFSIVLVRTYGRPAANEADEEFFSKHFGTVPRCMFTLFEVLASPNMGPYREVIFDYPPLVCFMVFFVVFGSFGISGLLTGVITESIIDKNQARIEEQRQEREQKRRSLETQSGELFDEMVHTTKTEEGLLTHSSKEHNLSVEELLENKDNILNLFQANGVSIPDYEFDNMVRAMDFSDSGNIERSEFVHGIVELCEDVRPMSIMELNSQVSRCNVKVENCKSRMIDMERLMLDVWEIVESTSHTKSLRDSVSGSAVLASSSPKGVMLHTPSANHSPKGFHANSPSGGQQHHRTPAPDTSNDVDSQRLEKCEEILVELRGLVLHLVHADDRSDEHSQQHKHPADNLVSKLDTLVVAESSRTLDPVGSQPSLQNSIATEKLVHPQSPLPTVLEEPKPTSFHANRVRKQERQRLQHDSTCAIAIIPTLDLHATSSSCRSLMDGTEGPQEMEV